MDGLASPAERQAAAWRRANTGFANLPDKGDLVGYPKRRVIRHDGAYTWHRADISEAHALRAIVDGTMRITTPSGEALDFRYERHVEHPSGDWTWVGRIQRGAASEEAIVTFGNRAAFGTIAQPGKAPLKLTIRNGVAWLIETDRSKIATIDSPATKPTGPDYFVPPKLAAAGSKTSSSSPSTEAASVMPAAAAAATATTVDVLLGYTNGFAAALGGQSQAVTRLNFMVEVANQAYVNSQVDARIRLVHATQVNYPDATDNGAALEQLTGYRSGSGSIPVDPAFNALRAARDQYGADLVSLVRKFNTPENSGCGIAWLIGGDRSGINSSDAPFAYSVVSDGVDAGTDGKNYFCREETLAHELGHNMGSQHDRTTATENGTLKYGVYDYSFGYKAGAGAGNFYTVMAYGDSGQASYRIFSNPRTTFCGGLSCGISGQADNALSLSQTMPIVGTFRATVVPSASVIESDYNGDRRSDILMTKDGVLCFLFMNGQTLASSSCPASAGSGYRIISAADFNGDSLADLLWTNGAYLKMWFGNGAGGVSTQEVGGYDGSWSMAAAVDMNSDGRADILMTKDGVLCMLFMSGTSLSSSSCPASAGTGYRIITTADFNGDGHGDILWGNGSNLKMWFGNGSGGVSTQVVGGYDGSWTMADAADMNSDGRADILMTKDGVLCMLFMSGTTLASSSCPASAGPGFRIVKTADFNGDNHADILWTNGNYLKMWFGNGAGGLSAQEVGGYDGTWSMN